MSKIETNLPTEVITALAEACGFSVTYDRSPGTDEWTLSHGHGVSYVQHTGTREAVCAFLTGYADMGLLTTQALNDLDNAHRRLILVLGANRISMERSMSILKAPALVKDKIEAIRCRTCGSEGGSCFGPLRWAVIVAVAFEGEEARTEFCYVRMQDYFESLELTPLLAVRGAS